MAEQLSKTTFLEKVFDYEHEKEWKYRGELPAIIDFYADWCGPCRMVSPILEDLAKTYTGKLHVYKVNTDQEQELAAAFDVQSIPTLLFIPKEGAPQIAMGALPKPQLETVIHDLLKVN